MHLSCFAERALQSKSEYDLPLSRAGGSIGGGIGFNGCVIGPTICLLMHRLPERRCGEAIAEELEVHTGGVHALSGPGNVR